MKIGIEEEMKATVKHSIVTPVYNRRVLVEKTYDSIKNLDYDKMQFEWVVVDDGSTDDLKEVIERFQKEGLVNINYIYQENGGIHIALNNAYAHAAGEYITRIDSDDYLLVDALKKKDELLDSIPISDFDQYCGVVGLCLNADDMSIRGDKFPEDILDGTGVEIAKKYKISGDRNFCMKATVLKKYPYPEHRDTKWVPDSIVWRRIDKFFITRFANVPMSVCGWNAENSVMTAMSRGKGTEQFLSFFYDCLYRINEGKAYLSLGEYAKTLIRLFYNGKKSNKYKYIQILSMLDYKIDKFCSVLLIPAIWISLLLVKR